MVSGTSLAVVADELEAADHLANGEEAEALGGDDTDGDKRRRVDAAEALGSSSGLLGRGLSSGLGGLGGGAEEGAGVLGGLESVLGVGLEGGDGRRSHLLAAEDNLGDLEADFGVVDDKGDLLLDKGDDTAGATADLAEGVGDALGSAGDGGAGRAGDAAQTLRGLGLDVRGLLLGGVGGLLGGGRLEAGGDARREAGVPQGGGPQDGTGGDGRHCDGRRQTKDFNRGQGIERAFVTG